MTDLSDVIRSIRASEERAAHPPIPETSWRRASWDLPTPGEHVLVVDHGAVEVGSVRRKSDGVWVDVNGDTLTGVRWWTPLPTPPSESY